MAFLVQVFEYSYVNGYLYVKRQSRLEIIRSFSTAKPANYADGNYQHYRCLHNHSKYYKYTYTRSV